MSPNLATLSIARIVIHDVPFHKKRVATVGPIMSQIESPMSQDLALFFSERIKETISGPNAFLVVRDPQSPSPLPQLIVDTLGGSPDLVATSQTAATHLHSIQTGVNPGGLLAFADCRFGGSSRGLGILKLEREEGVRLQQEQIGGKQTFQLTHLRELILTQKTKLYKIGLFTLENGEPVGTVCDQQRGLLLRIEIAAFFLRTFLGFRLKQEPTVSTKHFFEKAEDFISTEVDDPIDQATYHGHLVSDMLSNRQNIHPRKFANDYLKTRDRQRFMNYLESAGVPIAPFPKNAELIASRLKTTILEFESGIQVRGKKEALDEKLTLTRRQGREVDATIRDNLKDVRNK